MAFAAKRDGDEASQIYVLNLAGGEAERITSLSTGARGPLWSPDGKKILFVSEVFPGAADDEANKKATKALKEAKRVGNMLPEIVEHDEIEVPSSIWRGVCICHTEFNPRKMSASVVDCRNGVVQGGQLGARKGRFNPRG